MSAKSEKATKGTVRETVSTVLWALGIAFVLRTFVFQPFHIPSGSMLPGLMKGDYIITSKYSVGYGRHAATPLPFPVKEGRLFERELTRGDVVVFRPQGSDKNFIKRVIGLPGDQVQMRQGLLYINGERVTIESVGSEDFVDGFGNTSAADAQIETFSNGHAHKIYDAQKNSPADRTELRTVPSGHYFMMGDNRDHSGDSRRSVAEGGAGFVPVENIIGKAEIVLLSVNSDFKLFNPLTWGNVRGDRWFEGIE